MEPDSVIPLNITTNFVRVSDQRTLNLPTILHCDWSQDAVRFVDGSELTLTPAESRALRLFLAGAAQDLTMEG